MSNCTSSHIYSFEMIQYGVWLQSTFNFKLKVRKKFAFAGIVSTHYTNGFTLFVQKLRFVSGCMVNKKPLEV